MARIGRCPMLGCVTPSESVYEMLEDSSSEAQKISSLESVNDKNCRPVM